MTSRSRSVICSLVGTRSLSQSATANPLEPDAGARPQEDRCVSAAERERRIRAELMASERERRIRAEQKEIGGPGGPPIGEERLLLLSAFGGQTPPGAPPLEAGPG
jgi:hypothetical protein